jgi:hypothetical protein
LKEHCSVAGMSLGGGKKENVFFCLLDFYPETQRWFLKSLKQVRDEDVGNSDLAITGWVDEFDLKKLVLDFPLTMPTCESCNLVCPGTEKCHHPDVVSVRGIITSLLTEDQAIYLENPKKYESERIADDLVRHLRNVLVEKTDDHLLSKSFKRKLRKGFLPYWHRPLDLWVWCNYYDQILDYFKLSFDSFANVSNMLMLKFNYLKRHLPSDLDLYESDGKICLIELLREKIISKNMVSLLFDIEQAAIGRLEIIKSVEKKMNIFIYENDLELLIKNPKAFDSFILALVGERLITRKIVKIPDWALAQNVSFVVPDFSL